MQPERANSTRDSWMLLTNHGHVLVCILRDPGIRLKEVAARVGITDRAVQRIVADLEAGGVVLRQKVGRCNRYSIDMSAPLRHPLESQCSVGDLLAKLG